MVKKNIFLASLFLVGFSGAQVSANNDNQLKTIAAHTALIFGVVHTGQALWAAHNVRQAGSAAAPAFKKSFVDVSLPKLGKEVGASALGALAMRQWPHALSAWCPFVSKAAPQVRR